MSDNFEPTVIDLAAGFVKLIRTAINNPKVTLDATGLKSYDADGNLLIDIDANGNIQLSGTLIQSLGAYITPNVRPAVPEPDSQVWTDPATGNPRIGLSGVTVGRLGQLFPPATLQALAGFTGGNWAHILNVLDENGNSDFLQKANNLSEFSAASVAQAVLKNLGIVWGKYAIYNSIPANVFGQAFLFTPANVNAVLGTSFTWIDTGFIVAWPRGSWAGFRNQAAGNSGNTGDSPGNMFFTIENGATAQSFDVYFFLRCH